MKALIKNLNSLAQKLGYGKVSSYDKLWKTAINTFGHKSASMWFFTINLNADSKIVGIEIHRTYFQETPQVKAIRDNCDFDNPLEFEQAFKLIASC